MSQFSASLTGVPGQEKDPEVLAAAREQNAVLNKLVSDIFTFMPKKEEGNAEKSEIPSEKDASYEEDEMVKKKEDDFTESVLGMMDDILKPL